MTTQTAIHRTATATGIAGMCVLFPATCVATPLMIIGSLTVVTMSAIVGTLTAR